GTVPRIAEFADRQALHLANNRWDPDFESLVATLAKSGFQRKSTNEPQGDHHAAVDSLAVHRKAMAVFQKKRMLGETIQLSSADAAIDALAREGLGPFTFMDRARDLRIKHYLLALIRERIDVEVDAHQSSKSRLSDDILKNFVPRSPR